MVDNELLIAISGMLDTKLDPIKSDIHNIKSDIDKLTQRITTIEMSLENETNKNIQLLAENHMNLIDKVNQAIKVSDKTILYEVQLSGLKLRIEKLEKELELLKIKQCNIEEIKK